MRIENTSTKVIGFGEVTILPGEAKEITDKRFLDKFVLETYERLGLIKTEEPKKWKAKKEEPKEEPEEAPAEEKVDEDALREARLESLKDISEEDLGALARELGINPAECKDQAAVKRKVRAALKK